MKLLLIALTLTLSAQTFANCLLPDKKDFLKADKVVCDDNTKQILLEGIKVTKFDEEKNVLINKKSSYTIYKTTTDLCNLFGLGTPVAYSTKQIYSYLETGVEVRIESTFTDGEVKTKLLLLEKKQTSKLSPLKSIICNMKN